MQFSVADDDEKKKFEDILSCHIRNDELLQYTLSNWVACLQWEWKKYTWKEKINNTIGAMAIRTIFNVIGGKWRKLLGNSQKAHFNICEGLSLCISKTLFCPAHNCRYYCYVCIAQWKAHHSCYGSLGAVLSFFLITFVCRKQQTTGKKIYIFQKHKQVQWAIICGFSQTQTGFHLVRL